MLANLSKFQIQLTKNGISYVKGRHQKKTIDDLNDLDEFGEAIVELTKSEFLVVEEKNFTIFRDFIYEFEDISKSKLEIYIFFKGIFVGKARLELFRESSSHIFVADGVNNGFAIGAILDAIKFLKCKNYLVFVKNEEIHEQFGDSDDFLTCGQVLFSKYMVFEFLCHA